MFVPWHLQDLYEDAATSTVQSKPENSKFIETGIKDMEKQATTYHRYYHVFREHELENLIIKNFDGKLQIAKRFYDHANWVVIC